MGKMTIVDKKSKKKIVEFTDDGTLIFFDSNGKPLDEVQDVEIQKEEE